MPVPFALPLATSSTTQHTQLSSTPASRARFSSQPTRKRKRASANDSSSSEDEHVPLSSEDEFLAGSTNPLSLTPAEIVQRKLAGLGLTDLLPSDAVKDFPHRSLPVQKHTSRSKKGRSKVHSRSVSVDSIDDGEDSDEDEDQLPNQRPEQGPRLRLQHFSVLTAILHRCFLEGDLERASRAWAMLIRVQISGQATDLRSSGYWGIGAELLIKSLDGKRQQGSYDGDVGTGSDVEKEEGNDNDNHMRRWGTKEGLERLKEYYERLILQYPYKRQYDTSISALDFWPAMIGCEIYGIEFERKESLAKLQKENDEDEGDDRSGSDSDADPESEQEYDQADSGFSYNERQKARRIRRRVERRWTARDKVRRAALVMSEKLAARLDEVMATPPYSDSHNMLKLRGNIALYIGDLSVPSEDEDEDWGGSDGESTARGAGRRLLIRQRLADHERGAKKRKDEWERARDLFGRVVKEKGNLEDIKDFAFGAEQELHNLEE